MWQRPAVAAEGETPATANLQRVEHMLVPRGRRVFEGTVRILRVSIVFAETHPPQKSRRGKFPRRPWIDLTLLELKIQIRLE